MAISPLGSATGIPVTSVVSPSTLTGTGKARFGQLVSDLLSDVNQQQLQADTALEQLVTGRNDNVHDVVLSMAKADMAFRLVLEMRNRAMESYQEIMRMQI